MLTWLTKGVHLEGFHYNWPWHTAEPWKPCVEKHHDEYCNPTLLRVLPFFLGSWTIWPRKNLRTVEDGPCSKCRVEYEQYEMAGWTVYLR